MLGDPAVDGDGWPLGPCALLRLRRRDAQGGDGAGGGRATERSRVEVGQVDAGAERSFVERDADAGGRVDVVALRPARAERAAAAAGGAEGFVASVHRGDEQVAAGGAGCAGCAGRASSAARARGPGSAAGSGAASRAARAGAGTARVGTAVLIRTSAAENGERGQSNQGKARGRELHRGTVARFVRRAMGFRANLASASRR